MVKVSDSELGLVIIGAVVTVTVLAILATCIVLKLAEVKDIIIAVIGLSTTLTAGVLGFMTGKKEKALPNDVG